MRQGIASGGSGGSPGFALVVLSLATLMPALATSIANAALPVLAQALAASFQAAQWILLSYLLAVTTMVAIAGRLGDLVGRRRLLLSGIALFTAASALCGLATSLWLLIAARAAQGAGAAIMMALALAFAGEVIPKARIGSAMGLLGTMSAVGTMLGPSLGGILVSHAGWQMIFLVNVPLGAVALALAWRLLPADRPAAVARVTDLDGTGMALLLLGLGAYALAMTLGRGHFGPGSLALLLVACVAVAGFVRAEARAASPLIHLHLFRHRARSAGLAANLLVSTVMMATLVVGPFYLSVALGLDAAMVGMLLSVGPLVAALGGLPAGRLVDRFGTGGTSIAGLGAMLAGALALSLLPATLGIAGYVLPIVLMTGGYALFQAANNAAIMRDASPAQRGLVSGMLGLSRNLGLVTGASAMGAVFAFGLADVATAPPAAVAAAMRTTFGVATILVALALAIMRRPGAAALPAEA